MICCSSTWKRTELLELTSYLEFEMHFSKWCSQLQLACFVLPFFHPFSQHFWSYSWIQTVPRSVPGRLIHNVYVPNKLTCLQKHSTSPQGLVQCISSCDWVAPKSLLWKNLIVCSLVYDLQQTVSSLKAGKYVVLAWVSCKT